MTIYAIDALLFPFDEDGDIVLDLYYSDLERAVDVVSGGVTNGHYFGRLINAQYSENLWQPQQTRGARDIAHGVVTLANGDGGLDSLLDYSMDNGAVQVMRSNVDTGSATFSIILLGKMEQMVLDESAASVYVRENGYQLLTSALPARYDGSNTGSPLSGIEGTADDLKGSPKPMVVGQVFNITPKLVNTALLVYQVDGQRGMIGSWSATVYDKRSALTQGSDYTDQADMEANAPTTGQVRWWPAGGCFRLGSAPDGVITADVINPGKSSGTFTNVASQVSNAIARLATGSSTISFGVTMSTGSATQDVGIYLTEDRTAFDAINEVLGSINAGWVWLIAGPEAYQLGSGFSVISRFLDETQVIGEVQRVQSGDDDRGVPAWKVTVRYQKNYTVLNEADLAGVAAEDIAFCAQEYRSVTSEDSSVLDQYPRAVEIVVDSLMVNESDAQDEADRLLDLYKVRRDIILVRVPLEGFSTWAIGQALTFTYPRFGYDSGKDFQIIGREFDAKAGTVTLTLWG